MVRLFVNINLFTKVYAPGGFESSSNNVETEERAVIRAFQLGSSKIYPNVGYCLLIKVLSTILQRDQNQHETRVNTYVCSPDIDPTCCRKREIQPKWKRRRKLLMQFILGQCFSISFPVSFFLLSVKFSARRRGHMHPKIGLPYTFLSRYTFPSENGSAAALFRKIWHFWIMS